jgi:hypothetical protein
MTYEIFEWLMEASRPYDLLKKIHDYLQFQSDSFSFKFCKEIEELLTESGYGGAASE